MARWKPNGLISPREYWPEDWQKLSDEEARVRCTELLARAAQIPGLDELFAKGEAAYTKLLSGELTHEEFVAELAQIG